MNYRCYKMSDLYWDDEAASILAEDERNFPLFRQKIRRLLRLEIATLTHQQPQHIHFRYNEQGKPETELIHFNVSHTADWVCLAFHHMPIGVDIQNKRHHFNALRIAPRIMCAEQLTIFRDKGCPEDDFYRCWCIAEALVKQAGDSIWNAKKYPFILDGNQVVPCYQGAPRIELFNHAPDYYGAVAYPE